MSMVLCSLVDEPTSLYNEPNIDYKIDSFYTDIGGLTPIKEELGNW